jgi:hypothetical protein
MKEDNYRVCKSKEEFDSLVQLMLQREELTNALNIKFGNVEDSTFTEEQFNNLQIKH